MSIFCCNCRKTFGCIEKHIDADTGCEKFKSRYCKTIKKSKIIYCKDFKGCNLNIVEPNEDQRTDGYCCDCTEKILGDIDTMRKSRGW